jgi:hypothetical protein
VSRRFELLGAGREHLVGGRRDAAEISRCLQALNLPDVTEFRQMRVVFERQRLAAFGRRYFGFGLVACFAHYLNVL